MIVAERIVENIFLMNFRKIDDNVYDRVFMQYYIINENIKVIWICFVIF